MGWELAGALVLTGKKPTWKNSFLGSQAVSFFVNFCASPQIKGVVQGCLGQTPHLLGCLGVLLPNGVSGLRKSLSSRTNLS